MQAEIIDMDQWYATGRGGYADSYFNKADETLILKLNFKEYPEEKAWQEYSRSRSVFNSGIPCPEPIAFVTTGDRYGFISRRITGKRSLTRIVSQEPERIEEMAAKLAEMAGKLHSTPCDTAIFESNIEICRRQINSCGKFPDDIKKKLNACLDEMEPASTCLHGDIHPGNVITAGGKYYWIDLGEFGYGDPELDFGSLITLCEWTPKKVLDDLLHITRKQCREFTRLYGEYYYGKRFHDRALLRKLYHAALIDYACALSTSDDNIKPLMTIFRKQRFRAFFVMVILDLIVKEKKHN